MKRITIHLLLACIIIVVCFAFPVKALEYSATLAKMPVYAESTDKGVLIDLVNAIADETGASISIKVDPFARSMHNVISKKSDFHLPLIVAPHIDESTLDYDHSTETIFHVNFVLYTNKGKNINKDNVHNFNVETDRAHTKYFTFEVKPSSNIEGSIRKVDAGRMDAFIFADFASDPLVKKHNLKNINRELFQVFDVKIILPKGGHGGETDKFLSDAIARLRAKGLYDKIMGIIDLPYDNWQP